jgi:hypothetical protein
MIIIWGSRMCGVVDQVPHICHVATRFGHIYYIPLIPTQSYVVLDQQGDSFYGKSIGLSGKSVLVAWLRAALVVGALVSVVAAIIAVMRHDPLLAAAWALLVFVLAASYVVTTRWKALTHASYERAVQLGEMVGLSPEGRLMIEVAYGRMTADQADAELEKLETEAAAQQPVEGEVVDAEPH